MSDTIYVYLGLFEKKQTIAYETYDIRLILSEECRVDINEISLLLTFQFITKSF